METLTIPRPEYPRPQFNRNEWINLNGEWTFSFDFGRSGLTRGWAQSSGFDRTITVPFCPESALSGIGHTDFIESAWYQRTVTIPEHWTGKEILLHFGAVDFESWIYLDGVHIFTHYGGSASFTCKIGAIAKPGKTHNLVVHVKDDMRSNNQAGGKQSLDYNSAGCFYTRVTGIWQTVWMEAVSNGGLWRCSLQPDVDSRCLYVKPEFLSTVPGSSIKVCAFDNGNLVTEVLGAASNSLTLTLQFGDTMKMWSPETPHLYDITLEVLSSDQAPLDSVRSYAGMRKIHIEGDRLFLNNQPLFLRLVLDQGFYKEGIWTAPTDDDLKSDIRLSQEAGFNGARLHQKVFEERYHYWADKMGYLTWAESPSWGISMKSPSAARNFLLEWGKIVQRDRNHPSIIAWTPLNETWDLTDPAQHRRLHVEAYDLTKDLDCSRPVNGASGGCQVVTDLYTVHNYEQNPSKLREMLKKQSNGSVYATLGDKEVIYSGQPYIVDEFGGIKWIPRCDLQYASDSWGYGDPPRSLEEFYERLAGQVDALLLVPHISGYCYTQLTDVEQEQNGIYNYDRTPKFDMERIRKIFQNARQAGKEV